MSLLLLLQDSEPSSPPPPGEGDSTSRWVEDRFTGEAFKFWWAAGPGASLVGGRARLACTTGYTGRLTSDRFAPLRGSTWRVEVPVVVDTSKPPSETFFHVEIDEENELRIQVVESGQIKFREEVGGVVSIASLPYNPEEHRWWGIDIDPDGKVLWQTSADGNVWTTRREKASAISLDQPARARLRTGTFAAAELSPAYTEFDNFTLDVLWKDFTADAGSGDFSDFGNVQALPGRATVVDGAYRFEVQAGDKEPETGNARAEAVSGRKYAAGAERWFDIRWRVDSWDLDEWGLIWQAREDGGTNPPVCLQIDPITDRVMVSHGNGEDIYWLGPELVLDKWNRTIIRVLFDEADGEVKVWHNGKWQPMVADSGLATKGTNYSYDKAGLYRSEAAVETGVVELDHYRITDSAPAIAQPTVAIAREYPPTKLMWRVVPPGGAPARWAADEPDPANVIEETVIEGQMPGGRKEASGSLSRDPREAHPDQTGFSDVEISLPGGEVVWSGRLEKIAEASGERRAVKVECAGWAAALEDDKAVIGPGFIDSDLSKWGEPSTHRRLDLIGLNSRLNAATSSGWQGSGEHPPGISFDFNGIESVEGKSDRGEVSYYGGGVDLALLLYHFAKLAGGSGPEWMTVGAVSTDDRFSAYETGGDHHAATNTAPYEAVTAAGPGRKYAALVSSRTEAGGGGNALADFHSWEHPKILGDHGLAVQGTWPDIGFTAKQMLAHAIPRYAAPLEVDEELLDDDGFVFPQAWFSEPGPMSAVVEELTRPGLMDWFVKEGKLFQLRRPGTYGRVWKAFVGPSGLEEVGEDAQRLWESIVVRWQDVDGSTRTAGPPGSGAQIEDERLRITDPNHPAVKASVTRKDLLDLGGICTAEPAIAAGEMWLVEANQLNRAGQATFSGYLMDSKSVMRPVVQVDEGDHVEFVDSSDSSPRKIVVARYEEASAQTRVNLDAPPEGLRALQERYRARLIRLGVG